MIGNFFNDNSWLMSHIISMLSKFCMTLYACNLM
jgi:hypothetical protein